MLQKEYFIRLTCQIILNNISNLQLLCAELSHMDQFIILNNNEKSQHGHTKVNRSSRTAFSANELIYDGDGGGIDEDEDTSQSSEYTASAANIHMNSFLNTNITSNNNHLRLMVYLPFDHMKKIPVQLPGDGARLEDVFQQIKAHVSSQHADSHDYLFFPYMPNKNIHNILADISVENAAEEDSSGGNGSDASSVSRDSMEANSSLSLPKGKVCSHPFSHPCIAECFAMFDRCKSVP
jgi:hypothetical protein